MIPSPAYVLEEAKLIKNMELMERVQRESGAKILVALKGYALWESFPLIGRYLHGAAASGLHEAKLARETMNKEVHTFCPAIKAEDIDEMAKVSNHLIFNSFTQLNAFKARAKAANPALEIGIRVNPRYSEVTPEIYNPCIVGSRLGVVPEQFRGDCLEGVTGLHFHTHCEQNSDALERTLPHFEKHFGAFIPQMKWVNMGGGHHITRADYDVEKLIDLLKKFQDKWGVQVYLEPGEAVGWKTGYLQCTVIDIVENGMKIAILDASAAAHMPDVLEMPYRPIVTGAGEPGEKPYTYRLGGPTCLAGDVIGDYSFDAPLQPGDRIVFEDMIHYTMVKNNTFNGVPLPAIGVIRANGKAEVIKEFGYEDYKMRLS
ncbi:MAG: carboxynorspermidine decarboxylase [Campylobacterales bacterium]